MEIVPVRPDHVEQLRVIYLAQVARAPHCCFAPDSDRFRDELLGIRTRPVDLFYVPQRSQTYVAEASGRAQGFATLVTYQERDKREKQAITGLFFTNEVAGDALIRACEAQATADELDAFPSTHGNTPVHAYNVGWDGLSDRVPNVARLLARHGYTPHFRELHLIAQLQESQPISWSSPSGISIIVPDVPAGYLGELVVKAMDQETEIGVCAYSSLAFLSDEPVARRTGYIWWLHVNETYRRRGIARTLMLATREQLMMQGCTACWLTTTADNWGAQALYSTLDFDVVDCSVSFRKTHGAG